MTVIVGMVHEGQVWMGADRRGTWGGGAYYRRSQSKLYRSGQWIFGLAGNMASVNTLQTINWDEALGDDPFECWPHYVPKAMEMLEKRKLADRESDGRGLINAVNVLIGGMGKLYEICGGLDISQQENMAAIGTGSEAALGALWVASGNQLLKDNPKVSLIAALGAACALRSDCGPPFDVWSESGFAETVMD